MGAGLLDLPASSRGDWKAQLGLGAVGSAVGSLPMSVCSARPSLSAGLTATPSARGESARAAVRAAERPGASQDAALCCFPLAPRPICVPPPLCHPDIPEAHRPPPPSEACSVRPAPRACGGGPTLTSEAAQAAVQAGVQAAAVEQASGCSPASPFCWRRRPCLPLFF